MQLRLFSLTLSLILSSTLLGNISSFENNFIYFMFSSNQDSTMEDSIRIVPELNNSKEKFVSPGKVMLYSAVLPGLGQAYVGKWKRGLIYLALEGAAIGVWHQNNILAEERKKDYVSYAGNHWDFARWIHDYYNWKPADHPDWFPGDESSWDSIREVFINNTETNCTDPPYCYTDIWDHAHHVTFTWLQEIIHSSSKEDFTHIFDDLCGTGSSEIQSCSNDITVINNILSQKQVYVIKDHHFYEGIQKYDMFFAGWDDNDDAEVTDSGNNDKNITSPHQIAYRSIWSDYNRIKTLSVRAGNFMLINHFVSMIDGLFLAKKWNTEHDVKLNLDIYPDFRNKSGVGRVKLTMGWK